MAGSYVWGRGAMDDKASVVSILEAVERLVEEGHRPPRTVYLAFGRDEEIGGERGAGRIADLLAERGVEAYALVLDEGGACRPRAWCRASRPPPPSSTSPRRAT